MNVGQYQYVETWKDEIDLATLPSGEDDQHEYKSSLTPDKDLSDKISVAASAFWNTGGGIFVAGVDGTGAVDNGGILATVGRQSRRDWVDQIIAKTQPPGPYIVRWIDEGASIKAGNGVLVIAFGDSRNAHMAFDNKYYVRLGAHSVPANHYLVEAIRARKAFQSPILRALLQRSQRKSGVVELAVVVINESTALKVEVNFDPLPDAFAKHFSDRFPLQIPLIDQSHPFTMEIYSWGLRQQIFGDQPVQLMLKYEDITGDNFEYQQIIDVKNSIDPMQLGKSDEAEIAKAARSIATQLEGLQRTLIPRRRRNQP